MKRHPAKNELMSYAESLVARRPISAKIGGHITTCRQCTAEVEAIKKSLAFLHEAPQYEPSAEFTRQLLLAARNERTVQRNRRRVSPFRQMGRALVFSAALAVVCIISYGAALSSLSSQGTPAGAASVTASAPAISQDAIRKAAAEIQVLISALSLPSDTRPSISELEQRRAVQALHTDLQAAQAALERNPGCDRATKLVDENLQRQAQALKALYVERSL
jgi:anti-sigma factor RsiW